jgi:hypothetical protein
LVGHAKQLFADCRVCYLGIFNAFASFRALFFPLCLIVVVTDWQTHPEILRYGPTGCSGTGSATAGGPIK